MSEKTMENEIRLLREEIEMLRHEVARLRAQVEIPFIPFTYSLPSATLYTPSTTA